MSTPNNDISTPEFLDIIKDGGPVADEAMYVLLHQRLAPYLRSKYEAYQNQILDGFDDVLADFFFYLRDGKEGCDPKAYQSLSSINKRESFEAWMLSTFRNYLNIRASKERAFSRELLSGSNRPAVEERRSMLTDEHKLGLASRMIAYAHQSFGPRDRFVFLRILLTRLDREQAMPMEEMAAAMGMSVGAYRVCVHRVRRNFGKLRDRMLVHANMQLDEVHLRMSQMIYDNFTDLYSTLLSYYCIDIDSLACSESINRLRQKYLDAADLCVHEPEADYSLLHTIDSFWSFLMHIAPVS